MSGMIGKLLKLRHSKLDRAKTDLRNAEIHLEEAAEREAAAREDAEDYSERMKNIETELLQQCVETSNRRTDLTTIGPILKQVKEQEATLWALHETTQMELKSCEAARLQAEANVSTIDDGIRRLGEFEKVTIEEDRLAAIAAEDAELDDIAETMFARAGR